MGKAYSRLGLAGWLVLCFAAAWLGSRFLPGEWYKQLAKPSWTPPDQIFAPVWTILYILMAIAAWLVWRKAGFAAAALPLALFVIQLALNALWTWLFFGLEKPGFAFAEIVVLWVAIVLTVVAFWRQNSLAGALLVPYLAWVSFAAALNYCIWRMNV